MKLLKVTCKVLRVMPYEIRIGTQECLTRTSAPPTIQQFSHLEGVREAGVVWSSWEVTAQVYVGKHGESCTVIFKELTSWELGR